jgi:hypothetical protein
MGYKARMYDSTIGRFIQPDSIIPNPADPQSWNRYGYVKNNPLHFTDPAGHKEACGIIGADCDAPTPQLIVNEDTTRGGRGAGQPSAGDGGRDDPDWNAAKRDGFSEVEIDALRLLYENGGADAIHTVDFMLSQRTHFIFGPGGSWQAGFGSRGAWFSGNEIFLNAAQVDAGQLLSNNWALQNIVHEGVHIEQDPWVSRTWEGERQAWQAGLRTFEKLGEPLGPREAAVMRTSNAYQFAFELLKHDPKYAILMVRLYGPAPGVPALVGLSP